jgi:two-component system, NarL family, response regulator LiaR
MSTANTPITVALVNDYEIIVHGLAGMLAPFSERVRLVEMKVRDEPRRAADVALFDTFAGRRHSIDRARDMVLAGHVEHVLLYTWDAAPEFLALAANAGVSGVVLKSQSGVALVDAIERVAKGERIGLENVQRGRYARGHEALSTREQEVLALIALGMTNVEIGNELFLSVNTVKTYVRRLYGKLGVKNRAQAALHAAPHNLMPPPARQAPRVV